ncbi:PstS family phosphate ABC transporter substrate-binding protein [Holophaga foetida]|uniref:PstS family phosphate ABC transporter substrate-binding protein n=1 Tax=Holophaga foetida TaxID=35839 RepID=UPI00130EC3CE|nr:substrate-binding domain-containing protein [Holophaga foetida]
MWTDRLRGLGWAAVGSVLLLAGATLGAQAPHRGPLRAEGGECLVITMSILSEVYSSRTPGFQLEVRGVPESKAMQDLTSGTIQIALMARDAAPEELAAFTAKWGYPPTRVALAMDALVVVVHRDNPIQSMRVEETNAVFTEDRELGWPKDILTWGDANVRDPAWASRPIVIFTRARDSSVKNLITQFLHPSDRRRPAKAMPDAMAMTEAIAAEPAGICCANMIDVFSSLKAIGITPIGSNKPICSRSAPSAWRGFLIPRGPHQAVKSGAAIPTRLAFMA